MDSLSKAHKQNSACFQYSDLFWILKIQAEFLYLLCSFARAYHSNHGKEKIFDDYLAYDLMGKEEYEETGRLIEHCFQKERFDPAYAFHGKDIGDILNTFISPIPLSRASFAERGLWRFAYDRGECQYVICGAGMDTFAFRNDNPDIKVFEIDHPDTQRYKLKKIRGLEWNIPKNVKFCNPWGELLSIPSGL